jgi:PEGA domain-containing protein
MTRRTLVAVALVLTARAALSDDKARSRDGSSSSGHHASDAGARHHSPSSSSASDRGGASSSSAASDRDGGSGSSVGADLTDAQRRHPRAGTGTGDRGGRFHYDRPYSYRSNYYGFYPYDSYYFYGYPTYYYSGFYGYDPYSARRYGYGYGYRETGSLRVQVEPEKTRVYVDGYYAGIADDFDGLFQRLHLATGRHDITLKLEGYRTHRFRVYVPVDHTVKLHYDMVKGQGDDTEEVVGSPDVAGRPAGYARFEEDDRDAPRDGDDPAYRRGDDGVLRLDIRPGDASIYVDGGFRGTARDLDRLRLAAGRHRVEMVRPGYRTVERDVEIRSGETTDLRVELDRS